MTFQNKKRELLTALGLGFLALASVPISLAVDFSAYSLGNFFIFVSAAALGPSAALTSCAIYLMPSLLTGQNALEILRIVSLALAMGYGSLYSPRVPAYYTIAIVWSLVFGPLHFWLGFGFTHPVFNSPLEIVVYALGDISLAALAGAILLSSSCRSLISPKPRHVDLATLLNYLLACLVSVCTFALLCLINSAQITLPVAPILTLIAVALCLPAIVSPKIAALIGDNAQSLIAGNLLGRSRAETFSGRASDFLKRETSSTLVQPIPQGNQASATRSDSEEKFSQSGLANPDLGICAFNRNGTVTFVNRRFRSLLNISSNDIVGKNFGSVGVAAPIARHVLKLIEDSFVNGPRSTELKINEHPDKLRFFEFTSKQSDASQNSAISDGPDSIIVTVKEITDRRTVEHELLEAQKLKYLGETIAGIAHAFNNSLTTISGYASVAKISQNAGEVRDILDQVMEAANGAGELVHKLLEFAEGKPTVMKQQDLQELINSKLNLLRKMVGDEHEIELAPSDKELAVSVDPHLLTQALANLTLNAKESYAGRGGKICISLDQEHIDEDVAYLHVGAQAGDYARLRVKDFGHGMSREVLARAFDPLFTTKIGTGHSGLGLSIVYAIVKSHDGFLTVESHPEKGTTISIYFPKNDMQADRKDALHSGEYSSKSNDESYSNLRGASQNILVVEDEPTIRDLIARMLTSLGYKVSSCANGQEAMDSNAIQNVDLILVDMVMPRMNGLEYISRLRQSGCTIPTLVMTGYGVPNSRTDDGSEVLPKPFDLNTLGRAVKTALQGAAKDLNAPNGANEAHT